MSLPTAAPGYSSGYTAANAAHTMTPTWKGFIHSTMDALIVLEACLSGRLHHIPRRPHDRERSALITSGNVFIYEENASGIKRWTDGMTWSPSRIMGNFLVYRELNPNNYPSGEKKVARKRKRSADLGSGDSNAPKTGSNSAAEDDRRLVGSLVDSYGFKEDGLVKKTVTISYKNVNHHIICYYIPKEVKNGKLHRPEFDQRLRGLSARQDLLNLPFKAPIHDTEDMDPANYQLPVSAVAQMSSRSVPYAPSFAVQPAIQNYHGLQHQQSRSLHQIQTQYPNAGFAGSHALHVPFHHPYPSHMSNASSVSASPTSHSPSPGAYGHHVTYDTALQTSYVHKDQLIESLETPDSQQSFGYEESLADHTSATKRQKVDTPISNEQVPATAAAYFDNSQFGFDSVTTTYSDGNDLPVSTAGGYTYTGNPNFTNAMSTGSVSAPSYEAYDYSTVSVPQNLTVGHGFNDGYDAYSITNNWANESYQELHPIPTAGSS